MNRRNALQWISSGIAALGAAIVAIPGLGFVLAPILQRKDQKTLVQRIAQLDQLKVGEPKLFPVVGNRRDAWTLHENEVIGRVWVVRRSEDNENPQGTKIHAYSAECPHLGCIIQLLPEAKKVENKEKVDSKQAKFTCNCHKAMFDAEGQTLDKETLGYDNPSPRCMDELTSSVVLDEKSKLWWVEVEMKRFQMGIAEKIELT